MALVPVGKQEPYDERHRKAIYFMEKLFPYFEGQFDIHGAIKKSNLPEDESKSALNVVSLIEKVMVHEFEYAEPYPNANCWLKLTPKGKNYQDEINQQLLFDKLKQSPGYTMPIAKGMGVLLKGKEALIKREIIEIKGPNNEKIMRLNPDVTMASDVNEALNILERKRMAVNTTFNYNHNETHGDYSPISGRDSIINKPDEQQNEIAKQGVTWTKAGVIVAVIIAIVTTLISVLNGHY